VDVNGLQAVQQLLIRPARDPNARGFDVFSRSQPSQPDRPGQPGQPGQPGRGLVAKIRQPRRQPLQRIRPPFTILAGPDLSQPVALAGGTGPVGAFTVTEPSGAPVGTIRTHHGQWELHQPHAPIVIGTGRGLAGTLRRLDQYLISGLLYVLPYHIEFTAEGKPAFSLHRTAGLHNQFAIDIHQPWLDRRLILTQVLALTRFN
jgi:hypothetical protein